MASINTDPEDASAQAAPNGSAIPPADGEDDFEQFSSGDEQVNGAEDESVEDMSEDEPSSSESDMQSTSDEEAGKDETELQLEKLVFGDAAGFREAVQGFQGEEQGQTKDSRDESLADINDADLFFLDEGPAAPPRSLDVQAKEAEEERLQSLAPPAWEDSDDERMTVSLMAVPRLRKLRNFEGEDVISGKEYTRRLRRQYELLHPAPAWAKWRPDDRPTKRRRLSDDASDSDAELDAMDLDSADSDIVSQQPLAKLLRSTEPLTRTPTTDLQTGVPRFPPGEPLPIHRLPDISPPQPHAITSLSIHPTLPLLLTAGISSTLYLHHLLPYPAPPTTPNPILTTLHLRNTPLTTAAFSPLSNTPSDPKIYLSSPRRYYHTWTLPTGQITKTTRVYGEQSTTQQKITTIKPSPCGRYLGLLGTSRKGAGVVNILSAATSQWVAQARAEGRGGLADFAWWGDGEGVCLLSKGGEVTEWSVTRKRVVWRWIDEGAVNATVIALGADPTGSAAGKSRKARKRAQQQQQGNANGHGEDADEDEDAEPHLGPDAHTIIGTASGIVTVYSRFNFPTFATTATTPKPLRTLTHLTTPITHLSTSPDGQLLILASHWKKDALRLVHLPSCAVFRNWPTSRTPLGRVTGAAIGVVDGPGGNVQGEGAEMVKRSAKTILLVVGNEAGAVRCWELGV